MPVWFGIITTTFCFGAALLLGYALVDRLVPSARTDLRLATSGAAAVWLLGVVAYLLLALGQFTPAGAVGATLAFALGAGYLLYNSEETRRRTARDLSVVRRFGGVLAQHKFAAFLVVLVGLVAGAHLLRSLVAPPMAWDSLTYRLTRAALWVTQGDVLAYQAPGAWTYYAFFAPLADLLSAWAMLPSHTDLFLPILWGGVWVVCLLAGYSILRQLEVERSTRLFAVLAAGTMPAIRAHIFVAYADNLVLALVLVAVALFIHMERDRALGAGIAAVVLLATAAMVKETPFLFIGAGGLLFLYLLWRDHRDRAWAALGWVVLGSLLIAGPVVLYKWVMTGSPVYPLGLSLGDLQIFAPNPEHAERPSMLGVFHEKGNLKPLVWGGYGDWMRHVNVGVVVPFLLVAGALAAAVRWRQLRHKICVAVFGLVSVGQIAFFFFKVHGSGFNVARYAAPGLVLLILFVAFWRKAVAWVLLGAALIWHLVLWYPNNWSGADVAALTDFAAASWPFWAAAGLVLLYGLGKRRAVWAGCTAAAVAIFVVSLAVQLEPVRGEHRYEIYDAGGQSESFTNIPVGGVYGQSYNSAAIWEAMDDPDDPAKIAVTAGWDGSGHNWFVYPFLGRRLQNEIVYAPVAEGGEVITPRLDKRWRREADFEAWYDRLIERDVDYLALLAPPPLEFDWVRQHPDKFELIATARDARNRVYRVKVPSEE